MTAGWNIAILGATGAVGEAIIALLQERAFPVGEFFPLASERSAGKSVRLNGKSYVVTDVADVEWSQVQLAFFVAGLEASAHYAERAAEEGCIVIDSSGLFALAPDVPLIVPSVNSEQLAEYRQRNIIAVADSDVSQLLVAIYPLIELAGMGRLQLTNLCSVSVYGKAAVDELAGQSARLLNGIPAENNRFAKQLAFNLLPFAVDAQSVVNEECRLVDQTRKVLQNEGVLISTSYIQSPVFYGNAQMVQMETVRPIGLDEVKAAFAGVADIQLSNEDEYPTQVTDASGQEYLSIGCLRYDYGIPDGIQFWSVADNVRFGGALMAIQTAEKLIQAYWY